MASLETQKSALIVGGGCFGLATAYSLAQAGYSDITVLEKDDCIPSRFSAANDLNKVIRAEYADAFYTDLSLEAIRRWQTDPLFKPYYHETGFLNVTSSRAPKATKKIIQSYLLSVKSHDAWKGKITAIRNEADIKKLVPAFNGQMQGWSGYHNEMAGYGHSADALEAVYKACIDMGVEFHLGKLNGEVDALLYDSKTTSRQCIGAKTSGGNIYRADVTIVALGANSARLIPEIGTQVVGRCWGVVHIQLTPQEAENLRGIPVTNVRDLAFFFEPDRATNKLKFCHMGGGFTNYNRSTGGVSLPFSKLADSEFLPLNDEIQIRTLLREVLPQFADRPLIDAHLCWFADTVDSDYIIDYVPGTGSSLVVLSGDSGHGFKMLPIFGEFTRALLEQGSQGIEKWQWKDAARLQSVMSYSWRGDSKAQELADIARARL